MDISVVMACYNSARFIRESIDSVLNQTHGGFELIIVDDGSSDHTPEILESFRSVDPARIRIIRQTNRGPYPARNRGLANARGEFVAFLDADDWWDPRFLQALHETLIQCDADIAYCGWQNVGRRESESQPYVPPPYENDDPVVHFLRSCPWPIHAALTRRRSINAVGGFSERCFSSMDYDLWLRLLGADAKVCRVPEVLAYYRWHGDQISSNMAGQTINSWKVRRDFVRNHRSHVGHLSRARLRDLVDGHLLRQAYRAWWGRQPEVAAKLFRAALRRGYFGLRDLRHVALSVLPTPLLARLMAWQDRHS